MRVRPSTSLVLVSCAALACTALVGHSAVGQSALLRGPKAKTTFRTRLVPAKVAPPLQATAIGKRPQDVIVAKLGGTSAGTANDFVVQAATNDTRGIHHARMAQMVRGLRVFGSDAIVHLRSDGSPEDTTDHLLRDVDSHLSTTTPTLSAARAAAAAEQAARCPGCSMPGDPPELLVVPDGEGVKLAYRVQLESLMGATPTRPLMLVDATTGAVIKRWENLETATGASTYYGNVTITTASVGSSKYLEDARWKAGTFDYGNRRSDPERFTDADDLWNAPNQKAAVDAHLGLTGTLAYLKNTFGYLGLDGKGGPGPSTSIDGSTPLVTALVHYGTSYSNAFWDGSTLTLGDGDGKTFGALTSVDIVAHECGHGVIEATSGLIYSGESGALNESFADVLGGLVEASLFGESADTWKIGEKAYTPSNGTADALRYLDQPTQGSQPDHYSERSTSSSDYGGVHTNSGIPNKAFHLVAKGGAHRKGGTMVGIGLQDAARIWFLAFTQYMSPGTNFAGARTATIEAARSLFGATSPKVVAVGEAWSLVGVGTKDAPPPPPPPPPPPKPTAPSPTPPPPPPPPPPATVASLLANGTFEGTASPWMFSGSAFTRRLARRPTRAPDMHFLARRRRARGSWPRTSFFR